MLNRVKAYILISVVVLNSGVSYSMDIDQDVSERIENNGLDASIESIDSNPELARLIGAIRTRQDNPGHKKHNTKLQRSLRLLKSNARIREFGKL